MSMSECLDLKLEATYYGLIQKWSKFSAKTNGGMLDITSYFDHKDIDELNKMLAKNNLQIIPAEGSMFDKQKKNGAREYKLTAL